MKLEPKLSTKDKLQSKLKLRVAIKVAAASTAIALTILIAVFIISQLGSSKKVRGAISSAQIDSRANAYEITDLNNWSLGDAAFTTENASGDGTQGSCASDGPNYNVWFKFRAIHDTATISLKIGGSEGTMTSPYLILWDSAGSELACAAYSSPTSDLTIQYNSLTIGQLYYISVDNKNSASDTGTFRLDVNNVSDVVYYAIDDDDWDNNSTWSTTDGGSSASSYPTGANVVYIKGYKVKVDNTVAAASIFMIVQSDDTELEIDNGNLTVKGNFSVLNSGVNEDLKIKVKENSTFNIWGDATLTRNGGSKDFEVEVKDNANMQVNGDLLIDANAGSSNDNKFDVRDNAVISILGNLTLDYSGGRKIKFDMEDDSRVTVESNIYLTANSGGRTEIEVDDDAILYLHGDFVRGATPYGILDMNNNSKLVFAGTKQQQNFPNPAGSGGDDFTFQHIEFNNSYSTSPQISLESAINLSDSVIFTNGIVSTTSSNLLTADNYAIVVGGSASSYVDGPFKKVGNKAFTYPIGNESVYAPLGISAPSSSSAAFTAQYFHQAYTDVTSMGSGVERVSTIEYWDLQRNNGGSPGNDVYVTLHWTGSGHGITNLDSLRVVQYRSSQWEKMDPATNSGTVASGMVTSGTKANSFGPFTFGAGGPGNPLPIDLLYFQAKPENGNAVLLKWATTLEINNDYFTLYKSMDGEHFEEFATVKGAGNSQQTLEYSHIDSDPQPGTNYYLLKQTDFDGKFEYFNIVAVDIGVEASGLFVRNFGPNPFSNQLDIVFQSEVEGYVQIELTNLNGQIVRNHSFQVRQGNNNYTFSDLERLPAGIYIMTIRQGNLITDAIKLIKS